MGVLSDRQIRQELSKGTLVISSFNEKSLNPASYDLSVGPKALKSKKDGSPVVNLEQERIIQIGTAEFVAVLTNERLELPLDVRGRFGLRSYYTRKGLLMFGGSQVDPGFKGQLIVSLFNSGPRPIVLKYGDDFCTIEFSRLDEPSEKGYAGAYQDTKDFIAGAEGVTLSNVVSVMQKLESDVRWMKYLLLLILAAIITEVLGRFFGR